ncbi:MAG TPA: TetR/AcrR family transcriptional regulator [Novosphingobium sp.]|nr:TetR/AcrR family transcriptional regulator [Novosphingobium sp.]
MSVFRKPRQARARITFDKLLDAASLLLGEVGIERISSNLICERAGVTPPAFYRYFDDKYAILAALAERLMERQNVVLEQWTERMRCLPPEQIAGHTIELIRDTALVGDGEPGIRWILGALRAVPRLTPIRLESHAAVTQLLLDLYQPALPHVPEDVLRRRIRMSVEFGYMLDEMIREEAVDREQVWLDADHVFTAMATYPDYAPA